VRIAGTRIPVAAAAACLFLAAVLPAVSKADALPIDNLGPGDEHVILPPFASQDNWAPDAWVAPTAADVNGDGLDDTVVLLNSYDPSTPSTVWVTYSPSSLPATVSAGEPGWHGMRVIGAEPFWKSVEGVGDVNDDGFDDIAIETSDEVLVVFGRATTVTVDTSDLGQNGFRIAHVEHGTNSPRGVTSAGDQNDDGRPDIAFRDGWTVKVAYTPTGSGAAVDAADLGDAGFTLDTGVRRDYSPYGPVVGHLGDLNGDGRDDLAVVWAVGNGTDRSIHAVAAVSPAPGAVVDLPGVAGSGAGFECVVPDGIFENAIVVGDQNGDARPDLGIVSYGPTTKGYDDRSVTICYSPSLGVTRTTFPPTPGQVKMVEAWSRDVYDVGDQDGDGRSDLGFKDTVLFSSSGVAGTHNPHAATNSLKLITGSAVVGSLADRNGDGKRELLTAHALNYHPEPPGSADWVLDVFTSATEPVAGEMDTPDLGLAGLLTFGGSFYTGPEEETRTLAARASLELTRPDGSTKTFVSPQVLRVGGRLTKATMKLTPAALGLVPGKAYGYRLALENNRGLVGRGPRRWFTYRPPLVYNLLTGTGGPDTLVGGPKGDEIVGRGAADVLNGVAGSDILRGGGGADPLRGGEGDDAVCGAAGDDSPTGGPARDRLEGGRGADTIDSRDGQRDVVRCGAGRDHVRADARDKLDHCELVNRG
jgi:Ca2+-binding RTX toxin-like protein